MNYKILRLPAVKTITGLSRSSIYLKMAEHSFPRTVSLGARAVGWLESDINLWIEQQVLATRSGTRA
jgi:prophage regulatory protein